MAKQTMEEKVKGLLDAKDVVFFHTEGNTHFFMGKQHSNGVENPYIITAEIREKELDWECSCKAFEFADTCKHIESAKIILVRDKHRTTMILIPSSYSGTDIIPSVIDRYNGGKK